MESKKHVFTTAEKKCFMDILKKYSKIIESKDTDGATLRSKNEAWNKVAAEFNASPPATSQATHKQLRRLWMNLKQRQREALSKEGQQRLVTEGGPSPDDIKIEPDIYAVAPALIVGIKTAIDSDTVQEIHNSETKPIFQEEAPSILKKASDVFTTINNSEENLIPSTSNSTSSNRPSSSQINKLVHCAKANVMENEYHDRKKRIDEKHQLQMLILREQLREATAKANLAGLILKQKENDQDQTSDSLLNSP